ncbi:hypothetical protein AB0F91_13500 [Amycolatopsis sp. NPDC023774]|uniref:hypothetical protein n=1 Tax=Amycolatopsis sp. NPDC023774 TaxID=3155015 RepID=UPI0033FF53BB
MLLQNARRSVPWEDALEIVLNRVEGSDLSWFRYGSGALVVRGIDAGPGGDLDFSVRRPRGRRSRGCVVEWIAGVHDTGDSTSNAPPPASTTCAGAGTTCQSRRSICSSPSAVAAA